jgi:glucoamylase
VSNNDTADAANWLNAADYWQQNVTGWTYTTQGCPNVNSNCNSTSMYMRINTSGARGGGLPSGWNPSAYPSPNMSISISNSGGQDLNHRAIDIIDGGFLELVRMGVKRPSDPTITSSLVPYDGVIKQIIGSNAYPAWFRYNFDGYGETITGGPYDQSSGRGRLWPIFDAERGNYQIAATGTGGAGAPYLAALKDFSTPQDLHLRADLESEYHPAGRHGQSFRLDRDHAGRRHARHHHRFDGAAQLGAGRIHHSAGRYRRRPSN